MRSPLTLSCMLFLAINGFSQPTLRYDQVMTGFSKPVAITNAGDHSGRLFIVEQTGAIRILSGGTILPTPFLDISDSTASALGAGNEVGLLNIVFSPDYASSGLFYVYYADRSYNITITRFQVSGDPNIADESSGKNLLKIVKPNHNHYGSGMHFGSDGYLYVSTGDSGGANDPQNLAQDHQSLLGKMLRINVTNVNTSPYYTVPSDNPFATDPSLLPEIWDLGLRNPWRWSFDRQTHDMWLADVGQSAREEVNFIPANNSKGLNFAWPCYEGTLPDKTAGCQPFSSYTAPAFEYTHDNSTGGQVITGGFVYRGAEFPDMIGCYVYTDYASGNAWIAKFNGTGWDIHQQTALKTNIASFGEDEDGTLYAVYQTETVGTIYKVASTNIALPVTLIAFSGRADKNTVVLQWQTSFEENLGRFEVEYNDDNTRFRKAGTVAAAGSATGSAYQYEQKPAHDGKILYRLKMVDRNGGFRYSEIVAVDVRMGTGRVVVSTVINNRELSIYNNHQFTTMELATVQGAVLLKQRIGQGRTDIRLPFLSTGTYVVWLRGADEIFVQRVIIH